MKEINASNISAR